MSALSQTLPRLHLESKEQDQHGEGVDELDPQTRETFNALRETYANTAAFAADLLQDRFLQKQLRLIIHVLEPLHQEYIADLRCHKEGQTKVLYWHGDRACGSYFKGAVTGMLRLVLDPSIKDLFDLRPQPQNPASTLQSDDPNIAEDKKILSQYVAFIIELCGNRCWSQSFWTLSFPYALAGLYATQTADRHRCQMLCGRLANAILKLEDLIAKARVNADLCKLRSDVGTCDSQLVRECLIIGARCGYAWNDEELRQLVFCMFAGPGSTKDALESAFNHLKDSVKSSKSKKFNPFTKLFYLLSNPYVQHAGVEQVRPEISTFQEFLATGFQDAEICNEGIFKYSKTPLGKKFPKPSDLIGKFRAAGFFSNRTAAAASAFLLHDAANDFQNASRCWAG